MTEHVGQFNDGGNDWCIHCGTFRCYWGDSECSAAPESRFDSREPENFERMFEEIFGRQDERECDESPTAAGAVVPATVML